MKINSGKVTTIPLINFMPPLQCIYNIKITSICQEIFLCFCYFFKELQTPDTVGNASFYVDLKILTLETIWLLSAILDISG